MVKRVTLPNVRELLRRHRIFFLIMTAAALALRIAFFLKLRFVEGDSFIYGDIARNLLQHHTYGFSDRLHGGVTPTLIRLPGYPLFMAAVWAIAGVEHYDAVLIAQIAIDLLTCFVVAALALEVAGERAARWAFALAALCPFFANYATTPLTETPAFLFVALTFLCAVKACRYQDDLRWWAGCGASIAASILLRPDGGILLAAFAVYFAARLVRGMDKWRTFAAGALLAVVALAPLLPWTIRNQSVFHVLQPLAPRYANDPGEFVEYGYFRWTKTWLIDYVSIEDFYWPVPDKEIDAGQLPARACDTADQCRRTLTLFDVYNHNGYQVTPALDAQFMALANERIAANRFRYYVELPLARVIDLWFRPRTEMLPLESRWWDYRLDPRDTAISVGLGAVNLFYVFCGLAGMVARRVRLAGVLIVFVLLRTAFLGTMEAPESRYVLECFPVMIVFAAAWLAGRRAQA